MKNFIRILVIVVVTVNFACKEKPEQSKTQKSVKQESPGKQLIINFNFKTTKSDVFKIKMNNIKVDELQKKDIHIFEDVIPSTGDDSITAEFDANNMSNQIVFHLGNKTPKEVEIKSILVSYGDHQYNITTVADINKYLYFNRFIERDSTSKVLKTKRVDGRLNPSFRIKTNLINLLNKK